MMMVVDLDGAHKDFAQIDEAFDDIRKDMSMNIHMQRMDIYETMHRV